MTFLRLFLLATLYLACCALPAVAQGDEAQATVDARAAMVQRVDELVAARIKAAGFDPAAQASDEEFIRRVYLDLTGAIPRVSEVREFLADERPDKRAKLIDGL